jgi:hypothetical protein
MLLVPDLAVRAQATDHEQDVVSEPLTETTKPAKKPAPPLFRKHRRGIYTDSHDVEVIDATPQSPPLETDDPGVPAKGEYEINLATDGDLSRDVQRIDLLFVDANYGLLPKIAGHELPTQLKFEFPLAATRETGKPFTSAIGNARVGLKFNFYNDEHAGVSIALYPQLEFATGSSGVRKGLAEPGQTVIVPVLVAKELRLFTLVANGAVHAPLHDPAREVTGAFGVGVGRAIRRKFAAMVELRGESTFDLKRDRVLMLNGGVLRDVKHIIVYAKLGRSLFSDDGVAHTYVGTGIKVLLAPPTQRP